MKKKRILSSPESEEEEEEKRLTPLQRTLRRRYQEENQREYEWMRKMASARTLEDRLEARHGYRMVEAARLARLRVSQTERRENQKKDGGTGPSSSSEQTTQAREATPGLWWMSRTVRGSLTHGGITQDTVRAISHVEDGQGGCPGSSSKRISDSA
jgi:hypothetical protein